MYSDETRATSQSTLVNPEAPIELTCSERDSLNTFLLVGGVRRYKIFTPGPGVWDPATITDCRTKQVLANMPKKLITAETVIFPEKNGAKPIKRKNWLKQSTVKTGQ